MIYFGSQFHVFQSMISWSTVLTHDDRESGREKLHVAKLSIKSEKKTNIDKFLKGTSQGFKDIPLALTS